MQKGDKVNWLQTCRGGYSFTRTVAARVTKEPKPDAKRVSIVVCAASRDLVRKTVVMSNVEPGRTNHVPGLDDQEI